MLAYRGWSAFSVEPSSVLSPLQFLGIIRKINVGTTQVRNVEGELYSSEAMIRTVKEFVGMRKDML